MVFSADAWWHDVRARAACSHPPRLRAASVPRAGERVLVFAPHPDDETLGVGGVIYQARKNGADVRVVFVTSGDGFPLCAVHQFHGAPDAIAMRRLGRARRAEAVAAVGRLGVPADHVTFLGYPDRGLATLWLDHWTPDRAFTSPFTGLSRVPGQASFRPDAPYCGQSVLSDVEAILRDVRPDFVLAPDPSDDHPDHWVAHCFVRLALERLRKQPWAENAVCRTYLIHRGEWPEPRGSNPSLYLLPPSVLARLDVKWETAPLSGEALQAKRRALQAHRSQEATCGSFLDAFVRRNELLGCWNTEGREASAVPTCPARYVIPDDQRDTGSRVVASSSSQDDAAQLRGDSPSSPGPAAVTFSEATRDRWGRDRLGTVDFTAMVVEPHREFVRLTAELREPVSGWPVYNLYWKPADGEIGSIRTHTYRFTASRCDPPGTSFAMRGKGISVDVPRSELQGVQSIMVGASSWKGIIQLDSTPWRVVHLGPPAAELLTGKAAPAPPPG